MSCFRNSVNQTAADAANNTSFAFAPEPETLRIIRTVLFSLIAVLALVGNYVVCRAVWRQPGTKPFAYHLVSNLAFAEILSTVSLVFTIHAYEPPWSWKLGYTMCKILDPLQIASALVITTTLAILAVYRCLLLVKPLVTKPTRRQKRCVIIFTWMGSVGLSVPASVFRVVNSYGDNCDIHACEEVFPEGYVHYQDAYSVVLFVINFALPLVIMAISYALVSKKIREHIFVISKLRDEQNKALSSVTRQSTCTDEQGGSLLSQTGGENQEDIDLVDITIDSKKEKVKYLQRKGSPTYQNLEEQEEKRNSQENSPNNVIPPTNNKTFELENDLLKMVFALVLIFFLCYLPYQVQFLMHEFNVEVFLYWPHYYTFTRLVFTLTCLPSALHPVCYGMMSKFYHKAFIRMIACRRFTDQDA